MNRLFKNSVIVILLSGTAIYLPSCKKEATLPVVTTTTVSNVTQTSALAGGAVTDNGGADVTEFGVCWSTTPNPTIGGNKKTIDVSPGSFTVSLSGLIVNTKYYVRAYATNSAGTNYGNEVIFTTSDINKAATAPTLTTTVVTSVTETTAVSGGTITDDGGGDITDRGVSWSTSPDPYFHPVGTVTEGSGTGSFISYISGLNPGTTYYIKAYAANSADIAYGNQESFTTPDLIDGLVSDIDGNNYKTIQIGTQTWMAENLKTTSYNDGSSIPNVTGDVEWMDLTTGAYCWYGNLETTYKNTYGALYNWYTVNTGKLCPTGWHVPSKEEWMILATYLGGPDIAGGKLKESGTTHWQSPNTGATNTVRFNALPGGVRDVSSDFGGFFIKSGSNGFWWSSDPGIEPTDHSLLLDSSSGNFSFVPWWIYYNSGLSVRCLKD